MIDTVVSIALGVGVVSLPLGGMGIEVEPGLSGVSLFIRREFEDGSEFELRSMFD